MAWDFFISGINYQNFMENTRAALKGIGIANPSIANLHIDEFSINTINSIEDLLYNHGIEIEKQQKTLQIEQLLEFRSKDKCFAMAQLTDYYNNGFSSQPASEPKFQFIECSALLKKDEILELLEWLFSISSALLKERASGTTSPVLLDESYKLLQSGFCKSSEFTYFGDMAEIFVQWKEIVTKSEYDFYYWENSY